MNENFSLTPYYWRCQIVGATLYWLLFLYAGSISLGEDEESLIRVMIRYSGYVVMLIMASHYLRHWIKKSRWLALDAKEFWQRIFAASFIIGTLLAVINWPFDIVVDQFLPPPETRSEKIKEMENSFSIRIVFGGIYNALSLIGWTLIYWSVHVWYKNIQMKVTNQALALEQKTAQLSNLKSQLNPHFLFNSLNNIRAMIHIDADKASELITELSDLLRYSLLHNSDLVSLEKELEIVECFLNLEKVRLGERLLIEQSIDSKTLNMSVPPMMLQSLVENAVKHGISNRRNGGLLTLTTAKEPQGLSIIITNDGSLDQGTKGLGVGMKNTKERLDLLFGSDAKLSLEQFDDKVVTRVFMPSNALKDSA